MYADEACIPRMDSMTRVSLFLPIELLERLRAVANRRSEPVVLALAQPLLGEATELRRLLLVLAVARREEPVECRVAVVVEAEGPVGHLDPRVDVRRQVTQPGDDRLEGVGGLPLRRGGRRDEVHDLRAQAGDDRPLAVVHDRDELVPVRGKGGGHQTSFWKVAHRP